MWMWEFMIKSKDQALDAFNKFKPLAENTAGRCVKTLRSDCSSEFLSSDFMRVCEEAGIQHHLMASYSPQQNGVVQRRNRMVMTMARSLLRPRLAGREPGGIWDVWKPTSGDIPGIIHVGSGMKEATPPGIRKNSPSRRSRRSLPFPLRNCGRRCASSPVDAAAPPFPGESSCCSPVSSSSPARASKAEQGPAFCFYWILRARHYL
ncbi:uncharacterized protein LOC107305125 isoform X2 [Oryza brachyantha]|uniref:uncharacterized protein LOC107305125 isoform X2 n=1 Tax=Oryza brachyantha TaxID=4533 RepID=UPI000776A631|nr:uncharacterized protein LOC107305125 isoform X2 [Oryza brachyantha]